MKAFLYSSMLVFLLLGTARADIIVVLPHPVHHHRHHRRFRIYLDERGVSHRHYY